MALQWLNPHNLRFPTLSPNSNEPADDNSIAGLVAVGGALTIDWLRLAYSQGIFPWFGPNEPILWWSPDPRMVLSTQHFKVSHSLKKTIKRFTTDETCEIRIDFDCPSVIAACAETRRKNQNSTWIVPEMISAYTNWHRAGDVHSFECWQQGKLIGGLYGVCLGRMFFGESMFSYQSNASKIALAALVCFCRAHGISWIDCQQNTSHLASMGGTEINRTTFLHYVQHQIHQPAIEQWQYTKPLWQYL